MLQNDYLVAKIGIDTAENELFQVVGKSDVSHGASSASGSARGAARLAFSQRGVPGRRCTGSSRHCGKSRRCEAGASRRRRRRSPAISQRAERLQEVRYVNHTITFLAVLASEKSHVRVKKEHT